MKRILTGIKPTGELHLGNYVAAIKPAIQLAEREEHCAYFIADLHALNNDAIRKEGAIQDLSYKIAAAFLALGLDIEKHQFYRQSDIPQVSELMVYIMNETSKGLMNRSHAYKAKTDINKQIGKDIDNGINMGLYNYPILMAADILILDATHIPVGKDQLQHIEIARDIAMRFNQNIGEVFTLPEAVIDNTSMIIPGNDGRKMSKSYNNTISLFSTEKQLRKDIMKIKTDSIPLGSPIPTENSEVYGLFNAFLNESDMKQVKTDFENGIGYGQLKQQLYEVINDDIKEARERYFELLNDVTYIEKVLKNNGEIVRELAETKMKTIRKLMLSNKLG